MASLTRSAVLATIEARAVEIRKFTPGLSPEQAFAEAARQMPRQYDAYDIAAPDDIVDVAKAEAPALPVAIEKRAQELRTADSKLTKSQAIAAAARENPEAAYVATNWPQDGVGPALAAYLAR